MTRAARIITLAIAPVLFGFAPSGSTIAAKPASMKSAELHQAMRKLWSDHVFWTRNYIIDAAAGAASTSATTARLLKNQEDIGNAIKPYYGNAAGDKLTALLKQHILIAADLVTAAKAGDNAKVADADKRWHANANDIATFLSGANPHWPKAALVSMLDQHLSLTTKEATATLKGQWTESISTFDSVYNEILGMADALSDGIVKQFPKKF
jgi:hypothetical protein